MNEDTHGSPADPQAGDTSIHLADYLLPSVENGALARFAVESRCCRNPQCDCQEVLLDLHDAASGERLSIVIPLDQRPPFIRGPHPDGADGLLQELRNCLGLPFWEQAKRFYQAAKEYGRRHPWEHLTLERGLLVPYSELAPGPGEVLEFTCDGQAYVVVDQYCLDPACDCQKVLLDVQRVRTIAPGKAKAESFAVTYYDFRQSRFTGGEEGPLTAHRRQVTAAFLASQPDMKTHLRLRYARVREIGRQVAERGGFVDPKPTRPAPLLRTGRQ